MKILQISSAQSLGGGERHLVDLTNGLIARGHEVHVALRPHSSLIRELQNLPGANVNQIGLRNSLDAASARELSRVVRRNQIQIVHAHMARDYPLAAYASRMNAGTKLIVTRHVLFGLNRLHRLTLGKASRIIAVSEAVALQLRQDAIAPADKIRVVLNGIDVARFLKARNQFDRREFRRKWELPEQSVIVGSVGELTRLKGQEEILRAAPQILKQIPSAHFIVAGIDHSPKQENHARISQLIAELKLTERVRLVGWVEDLAQLYCGLDVFVSASHTESFGLAIAEAMASGTAIIATESEGARELIHTGESGLLVPIGDADRLAATIVFVLQDNELRQSLGANAQQVASAKFGVDRMVSETEEIYQQALALR